MKLFFIFIIILFLVSSILINFGLEVKGSKESTNNDIFVLNEELIWRLFLIFEIEVTDNFTAVSVAVLLVSETNKTFDSFTFFPVNFLVNNSFNEEVWCWCPPSHTYVNYTVYSYNKYTTDFTIHFITHSIQINDSFGILNVNNIGTWKFTSYSRNWPQSSFTTNLTITSINPIVIDLPNKTQSFLVYGSVPSIQFTQDNSERNIPGFEISLLLVALFLQKDKRSKKNP
ncbi:MAG: hypothetical protein HeimC3_17180 [Candidatus Heimdallarchaeota archaeon LC_3]|nr:MAG: hypothetical protein HeimC3_17180 [Candidatus Heimdallarchaeota archaeon LC_3]